MPHALQYLVVINLPMDLKGMFLLVNEKDLKIKIIQKLEYLAKKTFGNDLYWLISF